MYQLAFVFVALEIVCKAINSKNITFSVLADHLLKSFMMALSSNKP